MYDLLVSIKTHIQMTVIEYKAANEAQHYSVPQMILYHCQKTGPSLQLLI